MAKLLFVEDNEMNRDMLTRRLEKRGYQVVLAADGATGIALANTEKPDLILMDMSLPGIDGSTIVAAIDYSVTSPSASVDLFGQLRRQPAGERT